MPAIFRLILTLLFDRSLTLCCCWLLFPCFPLVFPSFLFGRLLRGGFPVLSLVGCPCLVSLLYPCLLFRRFPLSPVSLMLFDLSHAIISFSRDSIIGIHTNRSPGICGCHQYHGAECFSTTSTHLSSSCSKGRSHRL